MPPADFEKIRAIAAQAAYWSERSATNQPDRTCPTCRSALPEPGERQEQPRGQ